MVGHINKDTQLPGVAGLGSQMRAETARQVCGGPGRRGSTVGPHGRLWLASTAVARLTSVSMVAWIGWRLSAAALQDAGEPTARGDPPIGKLERPEADGNRKSSPVGSRWRRPVLHDVVR